MKRVALAAFFGLTVSNFPVSADTMLTIPTFRSFQYSAWDIRCVGTQSSFGRCTATKRLFRIKLKIGMDRDGANVAITGGCTSAVTTKTRSISWLIEEGPDNLSKLDVANTGVNFLLERLAECKRTVPATDIQDEFQDITTLLIASLD